MSNIRHPQMKVHVSAFVHSEGCGGRLTTVVRLDHPGIQHSPQTQPALTQPE